MANSYLFDTTYSASEFDASGTGARNSYRIIIGDKQGTQSSTAATEMELLDPGMNLSWQGDDTMSKAVMGGALSFTALLNDAQLATVETLMSNTNEGDVFCLFFNSTSSAAKPYWYGHLLMESVSIQVMNEKHVVDMQFTDGLGSLRGAKWEDSPGVLYTGFKKLSFYVREIVSKLPAYAAFKDYVENELSESAVPVTREIAWPEPVTPAGFEYDEADHKLDNLRVRAETFNKPKKQVERTRVLPVAPDYFSAADVLEDICNCFGATACIFDGYLNLGCRLDIATMKGNYVYDARYDYTSSSDDWTITGQYDAWDNLDADDQYNVLSGASKGFTMPISQVNITHEEGGSDELYANGWFINRDISFLDFDRASDILQFALNNALTPESLVAFRRDKFFDFQAPQNSADDTVSLPFYDYPADASGYLGFPAKTVDELEYQSGESMRLTFGGNAQFFARNDLDLTSSSYFSKVHIGSTLIVRVRIQMTDANGDSYRLSRTVHTHALTSGDPDFIRIDNVSIYFDAAANNSNGAFFQQDKLYFRKLYNDIEWLKDDDAGYEDDGWYEIIVPHGENENSGEGYGATLFPLTQKYDGQIGYAPIGTKIKKQNGEEIDGAGVILEESKDSATLMHYFREDIEFTLPYGNAQETEVLDFEEFYFEMGAQQYEPHAGPRGNGVASADGDWDGDVFLWKSAKADGTAYSGRYDGDTGEHFTRPDYIHFTGLRVTVGDGSEQSDLTTKITGGDGYEVVNLGSSRLGSRTGFSNNHVSGTVFAREKTADSAGSFVSGTSASDFKERLQWTGHRAGEGAGISDETYDSIHRYYGEVYINLFGKAREVYSMTLVPSPNSPAYRTLKNPFEVMEMNTFQTNKGIDEYLMPLKYSWTLNDGVSGEFIKVGQVRDITTITSDEGRPVRGGGGGIVGIGPGVDVVTAAFESKFVTDAITVDDETGDVTVIAVKAGSTVFDADKIEDGTTNKVFSSAFKDKLVGIQPGATNNASNENLRLRSTHTGQQLADTISDFDNAVNDVSEVAASKEVTDHFTVDGDGVIDITVKAGSTVLTSDEISEGSTNKFVQPTTFSNAGVLQPRDGSSDPVAAITADLGLITLIADSTIPSYGGVKKFTLADFTTAIVQGGYQDLVDAGVGSSADYTGTTGLLGDLNNDGDVNVQDLLTFLTVFGNTVETDNDLFSKSVVPIRIADGEQESTYASTTQENMYLTFAESDVATTSSDFTAGSNGVTVLANTDEIQFTSGAGLPITSWLTKKVKIQRDFSNSPGNQVFRIKTFYPAQTIEFFAEVRTYNSSDTLLDTEEISMGTHFRQTPGVTFNVTVTGLDGFDTVGNSIPINDPNAVKIKVRIGCRGADTDTLDFIAQIKNLRISLTP